MPTGNPSATPAMSGQAVVRRITANPRRVLIVEDNLDSVRALNELVRDFGHHVEYAINGFAALVIAQRWKPDFVLLDLGLPGMEGYEVCKRIMYEPGVHARIIAVTAYGGVEHRAKTKSVGFEQHLVKPVAVQALFDLLESGLPPTAPR